LRRRLGITQVQLARTLQVAPGALCAWLNGRDLDETDTMKAGEAASRWHALYSEEEDLEDDRPLEKGSAGSNDELLTDAPLDSAGRALARERDMFFALQRGDVEGVRVLLAEGLPIDAQINPSQFPEDASRNSGWPWQWFDGAYGDTLTHLAVRHRHLAACI